jgi:aspartate aminotransferase-like enzyme
MGFVDPFDVTAGITALGLSLRKLGTPVDVAAALSTILPEV